MILKTIEPCNKPGFSKNNGNELDFKKNYSNNKINRFGVSSNDIKYTEKSRKLKSKKLFKFQNSAKLEKKLSKSENWINFDTKKAESSFLIFDAKTIFNCL